jgi:hypothetical protein
VRVADTWFVALAVERRCEWITLDRDYARFSGLTWRAPEAGGGLAGIALQGAATWLPQRGEG